MAAAFLRHRLARLRVSAVVHSAGFLHPGQSSPPEVVSAMARCGLDVASHRSRVVSAADVAQADLVVGLARAHVRLAVAAVPEAWPQCFTLKELVRRGESAGPRAAGEPLADWLSRVQEGRNRSALLGDAPVDDVADPIGGHPSAYAETAAILDHLAGRLSRLCWGYPDNP
jgi:protein-tyrosine-phosphatase